MPMIRHTPAISGRFSPVSDGGTYVGAVYNIGLSKPTGRTMAARISTMRPFFATSAGCALAGLALKRSTTLAQQQRRSPRPSSGAPTCKATTHRRTTRRRPAATRILKGRQVEVPGADTRDKNEVVIAVVGTPTGPHVPKTGEGHGSVNLVVHEASHSIDLNGGGPAQKEKAQWNQCSAIRAKLVTFAQRWAFGPIRIDP
jgi:hypothetical protein